MCLKEGVAQWRQRKVEEPVVEVNSREVAKVTFPRGRPAMTCACLVEKEDEEGTGNKVPHSVLDAEMQEPVRDEGPAEKAPAAEKFPTIESRRAQMGSLA